MLREELSDLIVEQRAIASKHLKRYVIVDFYLPKDIQPADLSLLLINDGQDLDEMPFSRLYNELLQSQQVAPLVCAGIHAGKDRRNEYGTACCPDFAGRGAMAKVFNAFILDELLPFIHTEYAVEQFKYRGYAGFSLGGLTAIDMTWNHPDVFNIAGVFSGSLWWRSKDLKDDYNDDRDRIMHQQIKKGDYRQGLRFFFTTGSLDETADRNGNGIIDSIDDTQDLIKELQKHGYESGTDIRYINYPDGKHDVATWGRAMPAFLLWAWGKGMSDE